VYSYDIHDACTRTLAAIEHDIVPPSFEWLRVKVNNDVDRAARRVLANAAPDMTLLGAAKALAADGGIENLVVALGANNVLSVVVRLDYTWVEREADRGRGTIFSPAFFQHDWDQLVEEVRSVGADRVIFATVPHVTVVPLFRGIEPRLRPDSRYFAQYTHAWLANDFDPRHDPYLVGDQARAIDSAIDQYNETIVETVRQARLHGDEWYVLELAGLLDRLAYRRYIEQPQAQPSWWNAVGGAFPLPAEFANIPGGPPDTQFLLADRGGRTQGGLIALDGVHPTTIGYGLIAQEVLNILATAAVPFSGGSSKLDWTALISQDSLSSQPPPTLLQDLSMLGWINDKIDLVARLLQRRGV
jgi:hypothetical protein